MSGQIGQGKQACLCRVVVTQPATGRHIYADEDIALPQLPYAKHIFNTSNPFKGAQPAS